VEKRAKVTILILEHVARADDAEELSHGRFTPEGVLTHPPFQAATLKVAREELLKAISLIERTKWVSNQR
jgi:hypothetical protein